MLQARIDLIFKLFTVDGSAAAAGAGRIAGLQHEVWNYAVEDDVVVVAALGEGGEVGAGLENGLLAPCSKRGKRGGGRVDHKELAYLGGMVVVKLEGYRAL